MREQTTHSSSLPTTHQSVCDRIITKRQAESLITPAGSLNSCVPAFAKCNKDLTIGVLNAQSVRNKTEVIKDYITELDLDILFLTETWLRSGPSDKSTICELTPEGYVFKHKPRESKTEAVDLVFYLSHPLA